MSIDRIPFPLLKLTQIMLKMSESVQVTQAGMVCFTILALKLHFIVSTYGPKYRVQLYIKYLAI